MTYLLENNPNINKDIITRKEFYQYYLPDDDLQFTKLKSDKNNYDNNIIPRFLVKKMIADGNYLQFHSYQLFISNYINPNTPYSRLLMKWQTGTGKTIGALSVALNFIKYFRDEELQHSSSIGSVFILGFTAQIFKNELLRFPEFGIITRNELDKLKRLRSLAYIGSSFDIEKYQEFLLKIKKKFNNRQNNGFFRFIGYKKLVNMLFKVNDTNVNISDLDEIGIALAIEKKQILLNMDFLNEFKNSILICDEIHNVYNSLDKNNWGVALQYILNSHPSIRALFMSATPINNSPTEIIDLLNLLLPSQHYAKLEKKNFFDKEKKLLKGSLEKISKLCQGRVSYLRDSNPMYFPTKKFIGETINNAPYLKFIRCPMSEFHYRTYKEVYTGTLSPESQYLTDFALPNPSDKNIGMYQTSVVKKMLSYADQKWKDDNKIGFRHGKIVGDILKLANLSKISNKFSKMMETINKIINNQCGKIFIYHNIIHMSGVLFIQEILLQNCIIGEYDSSTANTLCAVCGDMRKNHSQKQIEMNIEGGSHYHNKSSIIHNIIDDLYYIKYNNNNITIKYNYTLKSYELYLSSSDNKNEASFLEFVIIDNIIVIRGSLFKLDNPAVDRVVKKLSNNYKVIIRTISTQLGVDKFNKNSDLYIIYANKLNNVVFYATNSLKFSKSHITNLIKKIDKTLKQTKNFGNYEKKGGNKNASKKHNNPGIHISKQPNSIDGHSYMPVRFMAVHSELDKSSINNSLNKYNSTDNSNGYRIMILVGGKLIKEAYDIKAVRELLVMGRPDNIPTLIQIMGRVVRKNSHKYLPEGKKNVNIRIFTSCLPTKVKNSRSNNVMSYGLGYEEIKYIEKLQHYKVIQNIEKILHENAIDAYMNKNIIWSKKEQHINEKLKKPIEEIGALYFKPALSKQSSKMFNINELNLQTFDAFYKNTEMYNIIIIIKRLFLEKSPIWKYDDLYKMVLKSKNIIQVEFNTELIDEESFIVALSRLVWANDVNYTEPTINTGVVDGMSVINNVVEKLFDSEDKIIILPGNQKSVITQVGEYYILFPLDDVNNEPMKIVELPYRIIHARESVDINIKLFLESGQTLISYVDKRDRFFTKWNNVEIENLELAVCDFGTDFHIAFLEECIKYIFNVWTNTTIKKSFMHTFYFKMINYYDLRRLVIWGHTLKQNIFDKYTKYIKQVNVKLKQEKTKNIENKLKDLNLKKNDMSTSGLINFLKSSINKSDLHWVSSGLKKQFNENLDKSLQLFDGNYKKQTGKKENTRVNADLVPVGHFLSEIPKFYHPSSGWFENPEYLTNTKSFVENNIIIGYDERSKTGVHIRFKIRTPIQNIKQFKDSRLIEKGSVCASKSKVYLREISQKIDIKYGKHEKYNVNTLCNNIRTKLIYLELKERIAKTNKKWFYFIYEKRPETIIE
jgi:hypothetical protein